MSAATTKVVLVGAHGRMGQAVAAAAAKENLTISTKLGRGEALTEAMADAAVVIDFSTADMTDEVCRVCAEHGKALVLGTTGQSTAQKGEVAAAAKKIPIVFAANFSVGVNALFALSRRAAEWLGKDFDIDVIELHHRTKKDAPSGTAKRLLEILRAVHHGEIEAQAIRAGDIVGEHTVIFSGPGERMELIHRAASREAFAVGALRAARWVVQQPAGLYSMEDVLGL
ncbi:MAG: 4-hydroxy-tetrahydrodipicolinate reductase [Chthoniobacterales bacterium]